MVGRIRGTVRLRSSSSLKVNPVPEWPKKAWGVAPKWSAPLVQIAAFAGGYSQFAKSSHPNGWSGGPGWLQRDDSGFPKCFFSQNLPTLEAVWAYWADVAT